VTLKASPVKFNLATLSFTSIVSFWSKLNRSEKHSSDEGVGGKNKNIQGASLNLATLLFPLGVSCFDLFPATFSQPSTTRKTHDGAEHLSNHFEPFCGSPKFECRIGNGELVMGKQRNASSSLTSQWGIGLEIHFTSYFSFVSSN
jgi:hypothetical protein